MIAFYKIISINNFKHFKLNDVSNSDIKVNYLLLKNKTYSRKLTTLHENKAFSNTTFSFLNGAEFRNCTFNNVIFEDNNRLRFHDCVFAESAFKKSKLTFYYCKSGKSTFVDCQLSFKGSDFPGSHFKGPTNLNFSPDDYFNPASSELSNFKDASFKGAIFTQQSIFVPFPPDLGAFGLDFTGAQYQTESGSFNVSQSLTSQKNLLLEAMGLPNFPRFKNKITLSFLPFDECYLELKSQLSNPESINHYKPFLSPCFFNNLFKDLLSNYFKPNDLPFNFKYANSGESKNTPSGGEFKICTARSDRQPMPQAYANNYALRHLPFVKVLQDGGTFSPSFVVINVPSYISDDELPKMKLKLFPNTSISLFRLIVHEVLHIFGLNHGIEHPLYPFFRSLMPEGVSPDFFSVLWNRDGIPNNGHLESAIGPIDVWAIQKIFGGTLKKELYFSLLPGMQCYENLPIHCLNMNFLDCDNNKQKITFSGDTSPFLDSCSASAIRYRDKSLKKENSWKPWHHIEYQFKCTGSEVDLFKLIYSIPKNQLPTDGVFTFTTVFDGLVSTFNYHNKTQLDTIIAKVKNSINQTVKTYKQQDIGWGEVSLTKNNKKTFTISIPIIGSPPSSHNTTCGLMPNEFFKPNYYLPNSSSSLHSSFSNFSKTCHHIESFTNDSINSSLLPPKSSNSSNSSNTSAPIAPSTNSSLLSPSDAESTLLYFSLPLLSLFLIILGIIAKKNYFQGCHKNAQVNDGGSAPESARESDRESYGESKNRSHYYDVEKLGQVEMVRFF